MTLFDNFLDAVDIADRNNHEDDDGWFYHAVYMCDGKWAITVDDREGNRMGYL